MDFLKLSCEYWHNQNLNHVYQMRGYTFQKKDLIKATNVILEI